MIFDSSDNKRWKVTLKVFIVIFIISIILISITIYSIINVKRSSASAKINIVKGHYISPIIDKFNNKSSNQIKPFFKHIKHYHKHIAQSAEYTFSTHNNNFLRTAFFVSDDDKSINDLKNHINSLDMVFPDYFTFVKNKIEINETVRDDVQNLLNKNSIIVVPRITNADKNGRWFGREFINLIKNNQNRTELEELIIATLKKYDLKAINIDVEDISDLDIDPYITFLDELSDLLHKNKMFITVSIPMCDTNFDYEEIGRISDLVVVMAYDQHYDTGSAGPIAERSWYTSGMKNITNYIPKNKIIISSGQYGYDWNTDTNESAQDLGFDDIILLAKDVNAHIKTADNDDNSYFSYIDDNNHKHQLWFLDSISLWNQMKYAEQNSFKGMGIWRLGLEDPSIWNFYKKNINDINPNILSSSSLLSTVNYEGKGEIIKVKESPHYGTRKLIYDGNNYFTSSEYVSMPSSYIVQRFGHNDNKKIALTFDDGPNPVYTPQILEILKQYNIKTTFFIVGQQAQHYPSIILKEIKNGHLLGNHTYYHSDPTEISTKRFSHELNAVQRLIQALSGKQTILFRPPYSTDSTPSTPKELDPLSTSDNKGYITVGADVDSEDYLRPGVDKIVKNVIDGIHNSGSNIIVMHDSGGVDRKQTVAALKKIIPTLKSEGYTFVNINELLGMPVSSIMPSLSLKDRILVLSDKFITWFFIYGWKTIAVLFFITTVISIFRIMFLGIFVLKSHKRDINFIFQKDFNPFVSILIPAYNEEKVIAKTIDSILKSNYKNYEIIIINDGSTDNTENIVNKYVCCSSNIRQIVKRNGGKYSALNFGFHEAKAEYIVTIDADTIILPDTIKYLIMPFYDKKIDAVCGNVQVGNRKNILTGFQNVEYITTQNYDRRAFDSLNCIGVVPGATGAWKKSTVLKAGGYSSDTLTEDADLTISLLENGAKIVYMPFAKSVTESPEKIKSLFKQRFRWSYGTFQTLWKHKSSFFHGTLGWIALPNILIFQLIFPVLSPIGDFVFILSIIKGDLGAILSGYILFLIMDLFGSITAFKIDNAPYRNLFFVLIQRFFYRQFMYFVTFNTLIAAVKGRTHGWNKIRRTNSVKIPVIQH